MKQFLLSAAFLFFSFIGFGQCPNEPLNLTTQEDIDNFSVNYPDCTQLINYLFVGGNDITNLDGLSQLQSSSSVLQIGSTSINDLTGLHNITTLEGGLELFNTNLENLEGLSSLTEMGNLALFQNQNLVNVTGLESVTIVGKIESEFNPSLENFEGLNAVEQCEGIRVTTCPSFVNFQGLESLTTSTESIRLDDNQNLQNFQGLENLVSINPGHLFVRDSPNLEGFTALENLNFVRNYIWVLNCDSVENLNGFENIEHLDYSFRLIGNENLNDISGFANLSGTYQFGIRILDNPNLSMCNIRTVCENLYVDDIGYFEIENNGVGCNSIPEVADLCGAVPIPDINFLNALLNHTPIIDANSDDLIQYSEAGLFTGALQLENKEVSNFEGLQTFVNASEIFVSQNVMASLNLSQNLEMNSIDFSNNPNLQNVNLKSGKNETIDTFFGMNCPNLQFVCVDDVDFAVDNFTNIDPHVTFVDDCGELVLAVEGFDLAEAVSVFPNPVSETLTISTTSNINFTKAEIYTINGQKLLETSEKQIDFSKLSAGVYFVKVISEKGSVTKKIVKQ